MSAWHRVDNKKIYINNQLNSHTYEGRWGKKREKRDWLID